MLRKYYNNYIYEFVGSHDTHIFRLAKPLDEKILLRLDYPVNHWQAENGNYNPQYYNISHVRSSLYYQPDRPNNALLIFQQSFLLYHKITFNINPD